MSMMYKGKDQIQKQCYKCGKMIIGPFRENDNAPTSTWWNEHKCKDNFE